MIEELKYLYQEIHNCHKCPAMIPEKKLRDISRTNTSADVFIISQALACDTLRRSGVNFYKENGTVGVTGKLLEKFLVKIDRNINPESDKCVYNTEIAQCFPGRNSNGKGDRNPSMQEIKNCLQFLLKEIKLIKPKLILLMGKSSRDGFYKYILMKSYPSFSEHVGSVDFYNGIPVIPIQHASGANPDFSKTLNNQSLIEKIQEILASE